MKNDDRPIPAVDPAPAPAPDLESQPTRVTPPTSPTVRNPGPTLPAPPPSPSASAAPASSEETLFPPGTRVAGRYRVQSVLGIGGMGVVYRAYDEMLDVELALKVLRPDIARDADFIQRFRNELVLARRVSHRHVVSNYDLGIHEGLHFMTMDLVIGRSLDEVLRERGRLSVEEAVRIVRQVAGALAEAHRQGIVHRDLKPGNILLDAEGDAYVTDFGIARTLGSGLTRTGEILGTPDYLSPEQARGEKVDSRSDIYTLGIILIQLLTGKLPFPGGTLLEVVAQRMAGNVQSFDEVGLDVSPRLTRVIERCLEKDTGKRYQTADAIVADLDDAGAARRRGLSLRTLAVIAAVLLVVAAAAFFLGREGMPTTPGEAGPTTAIEGGAPAEPVAVALPAPEPRHSVAVLPFPETSGNDQLAWASNGVAEMLATALAEKEDLRVVESVRVLQTLRDLGFQPAVARGGELVQLAELLRVDRLVVGSLRAEESLLEIDMSLVEVDLPGSPARRVDTRSGELRQIFELVDDLAASLAAALDVDTAESSAPALTPVAAAMEAYTRGLDHLSRRESLKAVPVLEQAVAGDSEFVAAWVRLSQAYQDVGRYDDALEAAGRAVRAASDLRGRFVYEAQAQEALLRGEPEEAQRFLEELLKRYPNDTAARIALAEAYGQQGRFADAISRLREAVRVDSGDARAWYLLGRFSIQSGDSRKAVDEYLVEALAHQKSLGNAQGEAEVYNALGAGYEYLGLFDQASENYREAIAIRRRIGDRRGLATSLTNLGRIDFMAGDYATAEESFNTALEIHRELGNQTGIAELYNMYGAFDEERGRYREALEHYRLSLKERSDLGDERAIAESHGNVGFLYYLLGEYDNALLYLERSLDFYRKNEDQRGVMLTLQSVGFCQLAQGDWSDALKSFVDSLEISRAVGEKMASAVSLGNLGIVAQYQGRYSAALSSYQEALRIISELGDARGLVEFTLYEAEALIELGALEAAELKLRQVETWQESGANSEQKARLMTLRGHLLLGRGSAEPAQAAFAEATAEAAASQSAVARVRSGVGEGLARLEAGRLEAAMEALRPAAAEADRLGNAIVQLHAAEALARAELRSGDLARAEDLLRQALRRAVEAGVYARAYALERLLAETLTRQGDDAAAREALGRSREEVSRVRENLDDDLLGAFDRLPEVRELS